MMYYIKRKTIKWLMVLRSLIRTRILLDECWYVLRCHVVAAYCSLFLMLVWCQNKFLLHQTSYFAPWLRCRPMVQIKSIDVVSNSCQRFALLLLPQIVCELMGCKRCSIGMSSLPNRGQNRRLRNFFFSVAAGVYPFYSLSWRLLLFPLSIRIRGWVLPLC